MTTLKFRKLDGTWQTVPITGPPGAGVPVGGLAGQVLTKQSATDRDTTWTTPVVMVSGTYVPVCTNFNVGSGGAINTADYVFIGGPNVGDRGILSVYGYLIFGSSGTTFPPGAGNSKVSLPVGFNFIANSGVVKTYHAGMIRTSVGGGAWTGFCLTDPSDAHVAQLFYEQISSATASAGIVVSPPTATFPGTWAAASEIRWNVSAMVVRV